MSQNRYNRKTFCLL